MLYQYIPTKNQRFASKRVAQFWCRDHLQYVVVLTADNARRNIVKGGRTNHLDIIATDAIQMARIVENNIFNPRGKGQRMIMVNNLTERKEGEFA